MVGLELTLYQINRWHWLSNTFNISSEKNVNIIIFGNLFSSVGIIIKLEAT